MLNLAGYPALDKHALVGACTRLTLPVDLGRLRSEVLALPGEVWMGSGGRGGVHLAANAIFLRGYAPAEGDKPIEDRPALSQLPYVRALIERSIPGTAMRCLLARLPAGGIIAPHIDQAPYFRQTLRLHIPVITNDHALMYCAGQIYRMREGEVWALNNIAVHAVWNTDVEHARTHLICDFVPDEALLRLLAAGERDLGEPDPSFEGRLRSGATPVQATA